MATKKISDFTLATSQGNDWLMPFAESGVTNYSVYFSDFQKSFGLGGTCLSVGSYIHDSNLVFNVYSPNQGVRTNTDFFVFSGNHTGDIHSADRVNITSDKLYLEGVSSVDITGDSHNYNGDYFTGKFSNNYDLSAQTIYNTAASSWNAKSLNISFTSNDELHSVSGEFGLFKEVAEDEIYYFFRGSLNKVEITPNTGFVVNVAEPDGVARIIAKDVGIATSGNLSLSSDSNTFSLDSIYGITVQTNQFVGGLGSVNITGGSFYHQFDSLSTESLTTDLKTAKAFRFYAAEGYDPYPPFYFEANSNTGNAFYFFSESGDFRVTSRDLKFNAVDCEIFLQGNCNFNSLGYQTYSAPGLYLDSTDNIINASRFFNANSLSLKFVGGVGGNGHRPFYFEANSNTGDAFYFFSESGNFGVQSANVNLSASENIQISADTIYVSGTNGVTVIDQVGPASLSLKGGLAMLTGFRTRLYVKNDLSVGEGGILDIDSDGYALFKATDTLQIARGFVDEIVFQATDNRVNINSSGSLYLTGKEFKASSTGSLFSLSDGFGYIARTTGDSFIDSDKPAITFAPNGSDTAHYSPEATIWMNKVTGFFQNSGSYDFSTLLRTGDYYMDSLKFAFVGGSGAAANFAIDLSIREFSGAASKIIGNTGALRMNSSDFIRHTSMDGRDYLETELDVGVVLKGSTYSYDVFTTIVSGNSGATWTGRLGIDGHYIKKSYTDFLTGGS